MSISYWVLAEHKLVLVKASGIVEASEVEEEILNCTRNPAWEVTFDVLVDSRSVTNPVPLKDYGRILAVIGFIDHAETVKHVCVANRGLIHAAASMWKDYAKNSNFSYYIFDNFKDACDWLRVDLKTIMTIIDE